MMREWEEKGWARRLLFVGVNAAVALAMALIVVEPIRNALNSRDAEIVRRRGLLARFEAIAAQEATVAAAAKQARRDKGEFLTGSNEGVVNADLQTRLKTLIEPAGAKMRALRILPSQTVEQVRYIGSRVEIYGSLAAVHRAIAAIETAKPFLFVRGAVLKPASPLGNAGPPQEPVIDAQLDVLGGLQMSGSAR
jgi:hypothetical protein